MLGGMSEGMTPQTRGGEGIDLGIGHPSPSLLPVELVRSAAEHRLSQGDPLVLQYGAEQGDEAFRTRLAEFLDAEHGDGPARPERLLITGGASAALDLLCTLFTEPGDTVLVEEPTYFLALKIFSDHGLRPVPVPIDSKGFDINALERAIEQHRPRLIYTIPFHQNPAGVRISDGRARVLTRVADRRATLVVSDEVYGLLTYGDNMPPASIGMGSDWVVSLGSFSKILGPGMRLGWLIGSEAVIRRLTESGVLDSGGGYNPFGASVVKSTLEQGALQEHVAGLRTAYARRRDLLYQALSPLEQSGWTVSRPAGGYFLWLTGPEGFDATAALERAREAGVNYVPGPRFSASYGGSRSSNSGAAPGSSGGTASGGAGGGTGKSGTGSAAQARALRSLRVSFSFCDETDLERGGQLLGSVLANF